MKFDHEIWSRNSIRISIRIRAISEFPNEGHKVSSKISEFPNEGDEISSKTDSISNKCVHVDQISSDFDGIWSSVDQILCNFVQYCAILQFWSNLGPGTKAGDCKQSKARTQI